MKTQKFILAGLSLFALAGCAHLGEAPNEKAATNFSTPENFLKQCRDENCEVKLYGNEFRYVDREHEIRDELSKIEEFEKQSNHAFNIIEENSFTYIQSEDKGLTGSAYARMTIDTFRHLLIEYKQGGVYKEVSWYYTFDAQKAVEVYSLVSSKFNNEK